MIDFLDISGYKPYKLFREHCIFFNNTYIKDLTRVGRDLKDMIIIDNSPLAYMLQTENALPILSWYDDPRDKELSKMMSVLERLALVDDVRPFIKQVVQDQRVLFREKMLNQIFKNVPGNPNGKSSRNKS